jgi:N6-L-threonylcarbamoyladenine synthase
MERLALTYSGKIPKVKIPIDGMSFNLSGLENQGQRLFDETKDAALVSAFVFRMLGDAISGICEGYEAKFGKTPFVFAGGVMSNSIIKARLGAQFDAAFAEPALSCDNAVGIACLTMKRYKKLEKR